MREKRRFLIHKPEEIAIEEETFRKKLAANKARGVQGIESGDIQPFHGHREEVLKNEYIFVLELIPESEIEIMERVVEPFKEIAKKHGVNAIYPHYGDMTPHVLLETGTFSHIGQQDLEHLQEELKKNKYNDMVARILSGLDFSFDTLVISGRDSYLCVKDFTSDLYPIYKARKLIEKVWARTIRNTDDGLSGLFLKDNYQDILHSTVARTTGIPFDHNQLRQFAVEIND